MKNKEFKLMLSKAKRAVISLAIVGIVAGATTACSLNFSTDNKEVAEIYKETISNLGEDFESELASELADATLTADNVTEAVDIVEKAKDTVVENSNLQFESATLIRVVDGDTIVVDISGEEYKVRLIGVNTPESVAPDSYRTKNSTEGVLASDYTKYLLSDVTTVYLEKDTSDTDRYGRLLRYVWLEIPEDKENINEIVSKMLNGILVMDNVAEVATYEPDTHYQEAFEYIDESF